MFACKLVVVTAIVYLMVYAIMPHYTRMGRELVVSLVLLPAFDNMESPTDEQSPTNLNKSLLTRQALLIDQRLQPAEQLIAK